MQSEKRNMERMVEAVPDSDYQVMQNFLTHSSWEHRGVMDRTASNANLYALIELVLPGGSVMALLLWLYRRRKNGVGFGRLPAGLLSFLR